MTGTVSFITNVIGGHASAYNAASGTFMPNGTVNYSGTAIGIGQTGAGLMELAGLASRRLGFAGMALGVAGAIDNYININDALIDGRPVEQSDVAGVFGNVVATAGGVAMIVGASGPIVVGLAVLGVGAGIYQIVASSKGWQIDPVTKQISEVTISEEVRRSIQDSTERQIEELNLPFFAGANGICKPGISQDVNRYFLQGKRDPLMLDLDGDGLELKSADGAVLFDHDGDGVRTATGWIGADDGILVRDLDGDGRIKSRCCSRATKRSSRASMVRWSCKPV